MPVNDLGPIRLLLDGVMAFTVLEGLALWLFHRATGHGLAPRDYALNLVSGLCLMAALRAALSGAAWPWMAVCLAASGAAHGTDLWRRWRRQRRPLSPS
ncbi:MAG: hypothetical protein C4535_16965 [Comamonadaceae bacterium]|nr:MAG: hypothetical protein C4535_16965 [Comamonadaceae bacterium]